MKKQQYRFYKKYFYLIFGIIILAFIVAIGFFISYRAKPSFYSLPTQSGVFQDPQQIDTSIKQISFGKYRYQNSNPVHQTSFRKDPTDSAAVHFANQYTDLSFFTNSTQSFAEANSKVEPVAEESSLTYPSIFPDTDLRYTVEPSRLLEEFIIHDQETALTMTEITQTLDRSKIDSYQGVDGAIQLYKDQKLVATIPKPVMYESGDQTKRSYDLSYSIKKLNNNTLSITKVIDEKGMKWLNSPNRQYPIVIDLVIDNADTAASWVSSDTTNTVVTQETTIKQEGTGSVKVATTAEAATTADLMEYSSDSAAQTAYVTNADSIMANGGTTTYDGSYTIHTFTSSGTFTVTEGSGNVEALVVGGGGGTGAVYQGGGGGGGGIVYHSGYAVTAQGYSVTVGGGGTGSSVGAQTQTDGGDSVFDNMTAYGGGRGGSEGVARNNGGSGGGASHNVNQTASTATQGLNGTARYGNGGGANTGSSSPWSAPGGGGAGAASAAVDESAASPGDGGVGLAFDISGSSVYYGGGGAGSNRGATTGTGGTGGGGDTGQNGTINTGGGGGAGSHVSSPTRAGGGGGSGVVIIKYETSPSNYKTQGSYSLKGIATTNALNKTLTRTVPPTLNLADHDTINFDLRSSRTGSNIKIGIHDSGGTTTEITPNITSADSFQAVPWDISGVSNANKDVIDSIIITIVNASAANTFYIDDMTATDRSINDTITLTRSAQDLSGASSLTYWVRSDTTGSFARFQFGESISSEQTDAFTINSANTWEKKAWDISGITGTDRDVVIKFAFEITSDTSGAILYFDDINFNDPPTTPSLDLPTDVAANQLLLPVLKTTTTDADSDYLRYKVELCEDVSMSVSCQTFDQTSSQTGWSGQNTETSTAYTSGTQGIYTLQTPLAEGDTFYWRSYAIDPGGSNIWSSTQGTPYSFTTSTAPTTPSLDLPTDTASEQSVLPVLKTTTTDTNSDYLRYKIELCEDVGMSIGCQTFDQTSSQTGWSDQDVETSTAYASGTQAVYTLQSVLDVSTTYYWRSYAIDPGGTNTWSSTQGTPYSFTTDSTPIQQTNCRIQESRDDSHLTIIWTDTATNEDYYEIERSVDDAAWSDLITTLPANTTSYEDSTITTDHTYRYRIAPYLSGPTYGDWCYTDTLSISTGNFTFENINF